MPTQDAAMKAAHAKETRAPSGPIQKMGRVTGWTTIGAVLIGLIPGMQPMLIAPLAGVFAGIIGAIGGEVRNHQHTYEEGGKREGLVQNGFLEVIANLFGKIL